MRYSVVFGALGLICAVNAIAYGGLAWGLLWPCTSFLILAFAYGVQRPTMLGKRVDGRIAWWAIIVYLPYFLLTWGLWHLQRLTTREPACHEVAPGVWLARRLFPHEVPPTVAHIVDLTCEFPERAGVRQRRTYHLLPILDGMTPPLAALNALITTLAPQENILIHCAVGHGRTGLIAVALLLRRGLAPDVPSALRTLRSQRPGIRLNPDQRRCAELFAAQANPNAG